MKNEYRIVGFAVLDEKGDVIDMFSYSEEDDAREFADDNDWIVKDIFIEV